LRQFAPYPRTNTAKTHANNFFYLIKKSAHNTRKQQPKQPVANKNKHLKITKI